MTPTVKEGTIAFHGYRTWYRVVGEAEEPGKLPILCLHGGPGATWHHMEPYEALAEGRRVVFYDQLGCGDSSIEEPHDPAMWTTALRRRGRRGPRRAGPGGRACAGPLVGRHARHGLRDHAAGRPGEPDRRELAGEHPVLAHGAREAPGRAAGRRRGDAPRPRGGRDVRRSGIRRGHDGLLPQARVPDDPWPGPWFGPWRGSPRTPRSTRSCTVRADSTRSAPSKTRDITSQLSRIQAPTLIFCGEHDEVTPATAELAHRGDRGSEFAVMPGCSHMSQEERPEETLGIIGDWLARVEGRA